MLFSSYPFLFGFLPITLLLWRVSLRWSRPETAVITIVFASLFFYGFWNFGVLWVLLLSIGVNYIIGGLLISRRPGWFRKLILFGGLSFNLGLLGWFKYTGFFTNLLTSTNFRELSSTVANVALPLGISFFTFQKIAYLVDCYRDPPARNYSPVEYAFFVSFFPQLIAGPIVHHREIIPQLRRLKGYGSRRRLAAMTLPGLALLIVGLAKKVLLADSFGKYASNAFSGVNNPSFGFLDAWGGATSYTLQIYFDFSGYSDMAIGLALLFGFRLPINFLSPYQSDSIIEFWRRWHITLSRFLRDYLYISLGGNRAGRIRRHVNLMLTMLLGGLWHGPSLTFLFWGFLHGAYLMVNHAWWSMSPWRMPHPIAMAVTLLAVMAAWIPFRAANLEDAFQFYRAMLGYDGIVLPAGYARLLTLVFPQPSWVTVGDIYFFAGFNQIALTMIGLIIALALPPASGLLRAGLARRLLRRRTIALALGVALWASLLVLFSQNSATFLYFQF